MPNFVDASYVSPLLSNSYYKYSNWKHFAALRAESSNDVRHTPFRPHRAPAKVLAHSLLESKTPRPTDTLYFCTLETVERADKFAAELFALGIEVLVLNEFDGIKIPYCNSIRLRAREGRGAPKPDWYKALLVLNKWNWDSHCRQEITDHPDFIDVCWFND